MRTFIAIEIPENVKDEIIKIQKQIPEFKGKLTEPENLHLTLKFLGEVDENKIEEVKERLREIKYNPFETEIDSIGFFSEKFIRIIWLHLKNCNELQEQIDERLKGLFEKVHSVPFHSPLTSQMKEKRFMSHLTIARVKSIRDKKEFIENLYKIIIPKMKFYVDRFYLNKSVLTSKGSIYENVESYRLKI